MNINTRQSFATENNFNLSDDNKINKTLNIDEIQENIFKEEYIEGDYSTYTTSQLKELSYSEVKENYDEIKEIVDERIKDSKQTSSYGVYNDVKNGKNQENIYSYEYNSTTNDLTVVSENRISKEVEEIGDLLNFEKQLKSVNYFNNDEINKVAFSIYQTKQSDTATDIKEGVSLYTEKFGTTYSYGNSSGGTEKDIFQLINAEIGARKVLVSQNARPDENLGMMQIGSNNFNIYDIKVNPHTNSTNTDEKVENYTEDNDVNNTNNFIAENMNIDYSSYSAEQLRELSFSEVKQNYDELTEILEKSLNSMSKLLHEDLDDLLGFQVQLEQVKATKNDDLNEIFYNNLKSIEDPKSAIMASSIIQENLEELENNTIDSLIINNIVIYQSDVESSTDTIGENTNTINKEGNDSTLENKENLDEEEAILKKEREDSVKITEATNQINLDNIINSLSKFSDQNTQTSYDKESVQSYSSFILRYNEFKDSLFL